jgi:REP element-mobilizing transposase RayT
MNRGAGRRPVFRSAGHQATFLRLLGEISKIYRLEIHAYCLMANHYHLLVRTPVAGLGRAMRHLDGVYTQRFNRSEETDGPLFRGRYKSVLVGEDTYLRCVSRYIHLNPLEAKLVARPDEYGPSSYRAYLGLDRAPAWLHTRETLCWFGPGNARRNYRRFVESGIDGDTRAFYEDARLRPVLGSGEFRERVGIRIRETDAAEDPERPDSEWLASRPGLDRIAAAVCGVFEVSPRALRRASKRRDGSATARGAFVYLGREVGGYSLEEIAAWAGYRSYAGASSAMGRLLEKMSREDGVWDRVEAARRSLAGSRWMPHAKT